VSGVLDQLKFNADGLIPAIVQDHRNGQVLMMAWMNRPALEATLATGDATYWSRSRQELWVKGATSGNRQRVQRLTVDCDLDAILVQVEQTGPACHENYRSCFFRELGSEGLTVIAERMVPAEKPA